MNQGGIGEKKGIEIGEKERRRTSWEMTVLI